MIPTVGQRTSATPDPSPEALRERRREAARSRLFAVAGFLLELSVAAALVVMISAGVLQSGPSPAPPVVLGLADVAVVALTAALGVAVGLGRPTWRNAAMTLFGSAAAATLHPPEDGAPWLAPLAGAAVGAGFLLVGLDVGALTREAPSRRARFKLGAVASLLGCLPCAAAWGCVLGGPTGVAGVALLLEASLSTPPAAPSSDEAPLPRSRRVFGVLLGAFGALLTGVAGAMSLR